MNQKLHPHLIQLERSATLAINERSAEMAAAGQTIYRFGFGQSPFPVPDSIVYALQENAYRKNYLPVEGLFELRQAVAEYHQQVDGADVEPAGIMIGPGSKELIFTLQLVLEGSTLIPAPCWVSYAPQGLINKRQTQFIQTRFENNWRLRPEQLGIAIQNTPGPNLLILNYPGNPDGGTYSPEELAALADVCRKNDILILSDEIYGRLHHQGNHVSIANYYPEGTIVSSGLSKWCGAGGWRLGHFAFPKELSWLKDAMAAVASETFSCVSAPIQFAAIQAYTDNKTVDEYLLHCRRVLAVIGNYCSDTLSAAGVNVHSPAGAFYLFPDFEKFREKLAEKEINDSPIFCGKLLQETGVALLPGLEFGRDGNELNARLAYVNFNGAEALKISGSISADKELTIDNLGNVVNDVQNGINNIINWITD